MCAILFQLGAGMLYLPRFVINNIRIYVCVCAILFQLGAGMLYLPRFVINNIRIYVRVGVFGISLSTKMIVAKYQELISIMRV